MCLGKGMESGLQKKMSLYLTYNDQITGSDVYVIIYFAILVA